MNKPNPKIRAFTWSRSMRLKRPYEVRMQCPDGGIDQEVPLQRFTTPEGARAFAVALQHFLSLWQVPAKLDLAKCVLLPGEEQSK